MCEKSFLTKGNLNKHLVTHKKKGAVVPSKVKQELPQESPNVGSQNESYVQVQIYDETPHETPADVSHSAPEAEHQGVSHNIPQDGHQETMKLYPVYFTM